MQSRAIEEKNVAMKIGYQQSLLLTLFMLI